MFSEAATRQDTVENIFAVGWKDKTTKQTDRRHMNDRYDLHIPRPQAIEMFLSCFSNMDVREKLQY
jgi:hypothetical protein